MTIQAKIKAKKIISIYNKIEITVVHPSGKVEHILFTNYFELVSEVELYESLDYEVYL